VVSRAGKAKVERKKKGGKFGWTKHEDVSVTCWNEKKRGGLIPSPGKGKNTTTAYIRSWKEEMFIPLFQKESEKRGGGS